MYKSERDFYVVDARSTFGTPRIKSWRFEASNETAAVQHIMQMAPAFIGAVTACNEKEK